MKELKWFGGLIAIFFLLWVFGGGPERYSADKDKPFIKPPAPLDTGEVYGAPDTSINTHVPLGWQSVATDYFTVGLPPGWYFQKASTSISNSYRGEFTDRSSVLYFEYGPNASMPVAADDDRYAYLHELIDGSPATLIKPRVFTGNITALYITRLPEPEKLSIVGYNLGPAVENTAYNIFRTVEFRY